MHVHEKDDSSDDEDYNPAEEALATVSRSEAAAGRVVPDGDVMKQVVASADEAANRATSSPVAHAATPSASTYDDTPDDLPLDSGGLRLHCIKGRVRCLCVNKQGTLLCAGGEDGQLAMWDFNVDLPTRRVQPTRVLTPFVNRVSGLQPIVAAHLASNDAYLVACQDGDCPAVVGAGGKTFGYCAMGERGLADVVQCKGHRAPVTDSCAHAHSAAQFYTCSQDGTARLWDQQTFERKSTYAVKHGSGQITDTVVVESVLGLSGHGGGSVFATAGDDGCVQLWDSRAKYRPGGAIATWDVYALPVKKGNVKASPFSSSDEFFERHTGGMAELAGPVLAVRRGGIVQFLDLRNSAALPKCSAKGSSAGCLAYDALTDLAFVTDTTPLASSAVGDTMVTCTSRAGFQQVVGGHVICYSVSPTEDSVKVKSAWRAGKTDDDVLCATMDHEGRLYAGLGSGDVVLQRSTTSQAMTGVDPSPVDRWLDRRPQRAETKTGRVVGQKSTREQVDVVMEDLF